MGYYLSCSLQSQTAGFLTGSLILSALPYPCPHLPASSRWSWTRPAFLPVWPPRGTGAHCPVCCSHTSAPIPSAPLNVRNDPTFFVSWLVISVGKGLLSLQVKSSRTAESANSILFLPEFGPVSREPGTTGMRKRKSLRTRWWASVLPLDSCVTSCKHLASVFSTVKWVQQCCLAGSLWHLVRQLCKGPVLVLVMC